MSALTQSQRLSVAAVRRLPWFRRFAPGPDGSVNASDRKQLAFVYRSAGAGGGGGGGGGVGGGLSGMSSLSGLSGDTGTAE